MPSSNRKNAAERSAKARRLILLAVLVVLLLLCWQIGTRVSYQKTAPIPETQEALEQDFSWLTLTNEDQNTEADAPTTLALEDFSGTCDITDAGDYLLTGRLDGTLRVDAKGSTVHLFFDGVTIQSSNGPAILIEDAGKVLVTLLPGSENSIRDSGKYSGFENTEACIYSSSDLTINGSGALNVYGFHKDAIRSKDVLKVVDGDVRIQCKRTGLHGSDGVNIAGGRLFIESEKNGVKTTRSGQDGRGCLMISGGTVSIVAGRYALVTEEASLYIFDAAVQLNGVIGDYDIRGKRMIEEGCVQ